jgi:hypothetical protein
MTSFVVSYLFAVALNCPDIKVLNKTKTWTEQDYQALKTATARCQTMYSDAPCLKYFLKSDDGIYSAICGVK